jgi:hypothetical protein
MTLCLAAACKSNHAIAYVFDEQVTTVDSAADVLSKGARVDGHSWALLLAGHDVSLAGVLYDRLKRELMTPDGKPKRRFSLEDMRQELLKAQSAVLLKDAIPGILPPQWSYGDFKAEGRAKLPNYDVLYQQIENARSGCDFMLAGFDDRDLPHIEVVPGRGSPRNFDRIGFCAMGSGEEVATHYIKVCGYARTWSARQAVYHLCAAKFFAESGYVGSGTRIVVMKDDRTLLTMATEPIRALWNAEGSPRVPDDVERKMPPFTRGASTPTSFGPIRAARKRVHRRSTSDL